MDEEYIKTHCQICGKDCEHLGSHVWQRHKIKSKEYKEMFDLPYNMGLCSKNVSDKQREHAIKLKTHEENFKKSLKYAFKPGHQGNKNRYRSKYEMDKIRERIIKFNNEPPSKCPVCGRVYKNVKKHLLEKHKLIYIN